MKTILIAGLGNPGNKYKHTRHNIGFMVLAALASKYSASFIPEAKYKSQTSAFDYPPAYQGGEKGVVRVILARPQTFMNNSGEAVMLLKKFFKIPNEQILVVHDEIDLRLGKIRLSYDGRSAGHNGIKSIIEALGQDFHRLRIGVDSRTSRLETDTYDYVLQNFRPEEKNKLEKEIISQALKVIEQFLKNQTPR